MDTCQGQMVTFSPVKEDQVISITKHQTIMVTIITFFALEQIRGDLLLLLYVQRIESSQGLLHGHHLQKRRQDVSQLMVVLLDTPYPTAKPQNLYPLLQYQYVIPLIRLADQQVSLLQLWGDR